ncbi:MULTISPECIES: ATP-binding cassette domain-containing protein [unclassified Haladaptatus]|uniref:ATP-binding cassette domain-containing protein n=1 Tax=unclassified Haladaptatus TaxID=2622732 RepID=UPI00209C2F40|nr:MULTISPECIES: ATP-binding cassette domain-containing protein [unclassified Haladaptatus]MCO8243618.1 ATP-binding cassette domain-containing protein [Haladaptatus sp. AB643]MCO8255027.1 ATP-binding cassette domain-containing protein [Haladaptatus sp. AB618]
MNANPNETTRTTAEPDVKMRLEGVEKRFGRIVALENIDLDVYEDQIFALVGDNGAGKSTMMNVLCGVHEPTAGQLYFDGEPVSFSNPNDARETGIETVYQDLALMNDLDVATNIFMGQFPKRGVGPLSVIDWEETYERADHIMSDLLGRNIDAETEVEFLSGGQRQLVAVGRALAFDPDVIILDEPTSALSVDATELVYETIRRLQQDGHTIIIVSHSLETVMEYADRIAVLYQGELVEVESTTETDVETLTELMIAGTASSGD